MLANNKNIADLEFDLSDGLRLIALVEVLSGKKFAKLNRRPNFRTQKLENVTMCLRFLEEDEGIKIVNIGMCRSFIGPRSRLFCFREEFEVLRVCMSVCLSVSLYLYVRFVAHGTLLRGAILLEIESTPLSEDEKISKATS